MSTSPGSELPSVAAMSAPAQDARHRLASLTRQGWVPRPDPVTDPDPDPDRRTDPESRLDPGSRLDPDLHPGASPGRRVPARVVTAALSAGALVTAALLIRGVLSDAGAAVEVVPVATGAPVISAVGTPPVGGQATGAPAGGAAAGGVPGAAAGAAAGSRVVVHVVGRVRRQGVVTLSPGARVAEAIAAAGGAASGAAPNRVNLARPLVDGEQVVVPGPRDALTPAGVTGAAGGGTAAPGAPAGQLDLNAATQTQLEELPGIGPVTAAAIIAWRSRHQRFSRVEELAEVDGIGPKTLERLRTLVRV